VRLRTGLPLAGLTGLALLLAVDSTVLGAVAGWGPPASGPDDVTMSPDGPTAAPHDTVPANDTAAGDGAGANLDDRSATAQEWLAAGRAVDAGGVHPGLASALARARAQATDAGIELPVASDHRTAEEQLALLEQEIERRGSRDEALHWVFPPHRSMHVRGVAVDVNSGPGADWLERHGGPFGLCKTLAWEWWHFEWRQAWEDAGTCPAPAASPDQAPGAAPGT